MWMGPHTYERDHSRVNGTTHVWSKPVDYQFTNGGPIYTWRSIHTRRYRLHVEDHRQPIPNLWTGSLCVTGSFTCERDMYVWTGPVLVKDLHAWTRLHRVKGMRCLRVNGFWRWFLHVLTRHKENYTYRLKLNPIFCAKIRFSAVSPTVMAFSFWQDYIKWDFARLFRV